MMIALVAVSSQIKNIWLRCFGYYIAVWVIVSWIFVLFNPKFGRIAFLTTDQAVYILCGYVILYFIINSKGNVEQFYKWICIATIIQCLIAIPQQSGIFPYVWFFNFIGIKASNPNYHLAVGTLENSNFFAAFIAISLPFFFRKYWCWFIPIIIINLILSKTTVAIVSASAGIIVLYGFNKWILSGLAVSSIVFAYFDGLLFRLYEGEDNSFRIVAFETCIKNIKSIPGLILGHGLGTSWGEKYPLHNEWIQGLFGLGIIGMGIVVGYVVTVYRKNKILFAAFCTACVNCIGNYPLHLPPSAFLIIMIIGLMEKDRSEKCYQ